MEGDQSIGSAEVVKISKRTVSKEGFRFSVSSLSSWQIKLSMPTDQSYDEIVASNEASQRRSPFRD
jgi:hypothetical protein